MGSSRSPHKAPAAVGHRPVAAVRGPLSSILHAPDGVLSLHLKVATSRSSSAPFLYSDEAFVSPSGALEVLWTLGRPLVVVPRGQPKPPLPCGSLTMAPGKREFTV